MKAADLWARCQTQVCGVSRSRKPALSNPKRREGKSNGPGRAKLDSFANQENARIKVQLPKGTHLEQAGPGLDKVVAECLRHAPSDEAPLLAWPLVCGSAVAERTRALSFADGVLCVEVADAGWKSELQNLAPRYLSGINRYTADAVHKIEFVIARSERARPERADKFPREQPNHIP